MQVVCVIGLEFESVLHVLHFRYVLVLNMLEVVTMCYNMGVVTPAARYLSCIYTQFSASSECSANYINVDSFYM